MDILMLLKNAILLVIGFALLIKGADFFVEGASKIADKFKIPQIIIGLTIVAMGTSAPEAAISISAGLKHTAGMAIGNVVGSNIMNILLILGIAAIITPLKVQANTIKFEMPFVMIITAIMVAMGATMQSLGIMSGIIFWVLFIGFFVYLIKMSKSGSYDEEVPQVEKNEPIIKMILMTVLGLVAIVIGSDITVDSASYIAATFGMTDRLIGLTIVAFGTSLPELITSVTAARKGKADIAIGNIIGSNIFNILFVLGTTCLITTVAYDPKFIVDGIYAVFAAAILWFFTHKNKELRRPAGIVFLICYAAYFVYLLIS